MGGLAKQRSTRKLCGEKASIAKPSEEEKGARAPRVSKEALVVTLGEKKKERAILKSDHEICSNYVLMWSATRLPHKLDLPLVLLCSCSYYSLLGEALNASGTEPLECGRADSCLGLSVARENGKANSAALRSEERPISMKVLTKHSEAPFSRNKRKA